MEYRIVLKSLDCLYHMLGLTSSFLRNSCTFLKQYIDHHPGRFLIQGSHPFSLGPLSNQELTNRNGMGQGTLMLLSHSGMF